MPKVIGSFHYSLKEKKTKKVRIYEIVKKVEKQ